MTEQGGQIPTQQPPPQWGQTPSQPPTPPPPQWGQPPPAPPRKKRSTGQIILLVIVGLFVIGGISNALDGSDPSTTPSSPAATGSGISKGLGSKDASGDVKLLSFRHGAYGEYKGTIEIVNHSDGTSDYYIELVILDQDGTNIDWTNAVAEHVRPSQRALVRFSTFEKLAHKAVITEIQRTSIN
jgi:hypothetical protein